MAECYTWQQLQLLVVVQLGSLSFPLLLFLLSPTPKQRLSSRPTADSRVALIFKSLSFTTLLFSFSSLHRLKTKSNSLQFSYQIQRKDIFKKVFGVGYSAFRQRTERFPKKTSVCVRHPSYFRPLWLGPTFLREDFVAVRILFLGAIVFFLWSLKESKRFSAGNLLVRVWETMLNLLADWSRNSIEFNRRCLDEKLLHDSTILDNFR